MAEPESTQSGTEVGYYVEARTAGAFPHAEPLQLGTTFLCTDWRRVYWPESLVGVRNNLYSPLARDNGMLSYETAQALIAGSAAARRHSLVDYRLRRVKMEYSWTITPDGVSRVINLIADEQAEEFTTPEKDA